MLKSGQNGVRLTAGLLKIDLCSLSDVSTELFWLINDEDKSQYVNMSQ